MLNLDASSASVFAMIERAAMLGERCPSNFAIMAAIGAGSPSAGPKVLERLVRRGLIEVQRGNNSRVVTIVASGKRTAGIIKAPHWRERDPGIKRIVRRNHQYLPPIHDETPLGSVVHRDPCPRCGVRGDLTCAHSKAPLTCSAGGA
jgi:hypothetical protein